MSLFQNTVSTQPCMPKAFGTWREEGAEGPMPASRSGERRRSAPEIIDAVSDKTATPRLSDFRCFITVVFKTPILKDLHFQV